MMHAVMVASSTMGRRIAKARGLGEHRHSILKRLDSSGADRLLHFRIVGKMRVINDNTKCTGNTGDVITVRRKRRDLEDLGIDSSSLPIG